MDGSNRLIGLVGDQCLAFGLFPVKSGNGGTLGTHIGIDNPCSRDIVQVGHSIDII